MMARLIYSNVALVGIYIARQIFHLHGVDSRGRQVFRKKLKRSEVKPFVMTLPPETVIAREACGGSHYWGRLFLRLGYETKLIHPKFAVSYRKNQKNDFNDTEAIAEAASRSLFSEMKPDPKAFKNGRQFTAWIGLVPQRASCLGVIAKRQNYDRYKAA